MPTLDHFPPQGRATTPPLSSAVRVGDPVFVSGTPGYRADGGMDDDFGAQFELTITALQAVLARAGASLRSLVKVNVLLTRMQNVAEMNRRPGGRAGHGRHHLRLDLAGQFFDAQLLDEALVQVASVTLGRGKPLFPRRVTSPPWKLLSVRQVGTGFAELHYQLPKAGAQAADGGLA